MFSSIKFLQYPAHLRQVSIVIYDILCIILAYYLAYVLRFESFTISEFKSSLFLQNWLLNSTLQVATIFFMGVHRGLWRFVSTTDLKLIINAVIIAIIVSFIGTFLLNRLEYTPRSIYLLDALLLTIFLGSGRFAYRMIKQDSKLTHTKNAILIGAGFAGEQLIRELRRNADRIDYNICCILDDDPQKIGRTIHGIKVRGSIDKLSIYQNKYQTQLTLIAIPSASSKNYPSYLFFS